jgi:hypothetical protein
MFAKNKSKKIRMRRKSLRGTVSNANFYYSRYLRIAEVKRSDNKKQIDVLGMGYEI